MFLEDKNKVTSRFKKENKIIKEKNNISLEKEIKSFDLSEDEKIKIFDLIQDINTFYG